MERSSAERRIVTVLFADLVGFTSLSEGLDAEDVAAVQGAYFAAVRETVGRYGGRLEKFIGDAAMAVFGVPRVREDDAERAVRAALALAAAVEQLAARLELDGAALQVRVGVNTGEVVANPDAGADEAMVTGDAVNVAARLQAAADPGGVLVGETTALAVADAVELEPAGALELKGKAEAVRASRAVGLRAERSREQAMGGLRAPLLGRERELGELLDAFAAVAPGTSARVLVLAPPGVGKTRLVEEVALRCGPDVLRARLRPDIVAPYDAVGQLAAAAHGDGDLEALRGRLRAAGTSPARTEVVVEEFSALLAPSGGGTAGRDRDLGESRDLRFAAWLEALDALAPGRSLWLVEDAHWAGVDLLAFLDAATSAASRDGRLILVTARPSLLDAAPAWCARRADVAVLELDPLTPAGVGELARALVGDALPGDLVERIAERSDGNPLFVEELLRTWVSVGTLVLEAGRWRLTAPAADVPLPPTVQALYAAQLDDLPAAARTVARRASVAGRRFPLAALDRLGVDAGHEGVAALQRRALVDGPHRDRLAGATYAYRHALLRDTGYASLARAERALLHVRLAGWLADGAGERAGPVAELIGRHYADALASAPALAREVAPGLGRAETARLAAAWLERGADAALELSAFAAARSLLSRALELTSPEAAEDEARRRRKLGEVTASSASMDEAASELERALELARAVGHRGEIARAAAELSRVLDQQVQFMPAARMADEALTELGERDDVETALLLLRRAIAVSNGSDAIDGPRADAERALALARAVGDRRLELEAQTLLAGLAEDALEAFEELERVARQESAWPTVVGALGTQVLLLAPDRAAEAVPLAERAVELAEARGLRDSLAWSHYGLVEVGLVSGDWDAAHAAARRALDLGIANGYDRPVVRTWSAILPLAAARMDRELLGEAHAWFTERFREPESPSPYALILLAARRLYVAAGGFLPRVVPDVDERLPSFGVGYSSPSWVAALEVVVDAWLEAGELDGVAAALDRLETTIPGAAGPELVGATHALLRGRLLARRGEAAAAADEAARALAGFRRVSAPWWVAKAIRLREALDRVTAAELTEAAAIERALRV